MDNIDETYLPLMTSIQNLEGSHQIGESVLLSYSGLEYSSEIIQILFHNDISTEVLNKIDFSDFVRKMGEKLKQSFQKFLLAILNFIQSLSNILKGRSIEEQAEWYENNKSGIQHGYKRANPSLVVTTSFPIGIDGKKFAQLSQTMSKVIDEIDKSIKMQAYALIKHHKTIIKEKSLFGRLKSVTIPKIKSYALLYSALNKSPIIKNVFKIILGDTFQLSNFSNPISALNMLIYGQENKPKPQQIRISKMFKVNQFDDLTVKSSEMIKKLNESIQSMAKNFKNDIKNLEKTMNHIERDIKNKDNRVKKDADILISIRQIHQLFDGMRLIVSATLHISMGLFGNYLKYRQLLLKAAQICVQPLKTDNIVYSQ